MTDFEQIESGDRVILYPAKNNPLHNKPVKALFLDGYYYCDGSDPDFCPDYHFRDVWVFCNGYDKL